LVRTLGAAGVAAEAVATRAVLGGGTTPDQTLASWGVALAGGDATAARLRRATPPVIGRVDEDRVVVDLRAVPPEHDRLLRRALVEALRG
jgi:L-seryl-tRNA(Ser) seleniumtransferase